MARLLHSIQPLNMSLVLRIRTETLCESLYRAYETLKNLSGVHERLEGIKQALLKASDEMKEHAKTVEDVLYDLQEPSALEPVAAWMNALRLRLSIGLKNQLRLIEDQSFIAKVKASAVIEWQNRLRGLALDQLNRISSEAGTWPGLSSIEADAKEMVFAASVELLGGIALRDARLNAEVCELAEVLLTMIRSTQAHRWAMLGGQTSILMRLRNVIRLPFPQWSVWHLPFAVHELWQVEEDNFRELKRRLQATQAAALSEPDIDQRMADACSTYVLGPAFAYAAITLSFNPSDPRFDRRVDAICAMLTHMTDQEGGDSYKQKVAGMIESEWKLAAAAARQAAPATKIGPGDQFVRRLRDALMNELGTQGQQDAVWAAWDRAVATLHTLPTEPSEATDDFERLCAPLAAALQAAGFLSFPQTAWHKVKKDWKSVLEPNSPERDLRHVLNAAWEARIDAEVKARHLSEMVGDPEDMAEEDRGAWDLLTDEEKKAKLLADLIRARAGVSLGKVGARADKRQLPGGQLR
jgi:hypothetical protein